MALKASSNTLLPDLKNDPSEPLSAAGIEGGIFGEEEGTLLLALEIAILSHVLNASTPSSGPNPQVADVSLEVLVLS